MKISVVAPVFNEEESLQLFVDRVLDVVSRGNSNDVWELILIDDGSSDETPKIISRLCDEHSVIKGVFFTRNFGHQPAIMAGLLHSSGEAIVILDSDLQDPPELIPELLSCSMAGFDVVNAVRVRRTGETLKKRLFAALFYRILRKLVNFDIGVDSGDYRLITRKVRDVLVQSAKGAQYLRGQIAWFGYRTAEVAYERDARKFGSTKYTFQKSLQLAIDAVVSLSGKPLRVVSVLGVILGCIVGLTPVVLTIVAAVYGPTDNHASKVLDRINAIGISAALVSVAVIAAYVGRLMFQVRTLPPFVVRETKNLETSDGK